MQPEVASVNPTTTADFWDGDLLEPSVQVGDGVPSVSRKRAALGPYFVGPQHAECVPVRAAGPFDHRRMDPATAFMANWASGRCLCSNQSGIYQRAAATAGKGRRVARNASSSAMN